MSGPAISNSDGAAVSIDHGHFISANTLGLLAAAIPTAGTPSAARRSPSAVATCSATTGTRRAGRRRSWPTRKALGRYAAQRALARLGSRKLSTRKVPVLYEAPLALGLLGSFVQATSGSALYRKTSFLVDSLGKRIFPEHIRIHEDPFIYGAMGSGPFDDEGVATAARDVVQRRRAAGLLPVQLQRPQARHADHRQRRRITQPDALEQPDPQGRRLRCDAAQARHRPAAPTAMHCRLLVRFMCSWLVVWSRAMFAHALPPRERAPGRIAAPRVRVRGPNLDSSTTARPRQRESSAG